MSHEQAILFGPPTAKRAAYVQMLRRHGLAVISCATPATVLRHLQKGSVHSIFITDETKPGIMVRLLNLCRWEPHSAIFYLGIPPALLAPKLGNWPGLVIVPSAIEEVLPDPRFGMPADRPPSTDSGGTKPLSGPGVLMVNTEYPLSFQAARAQFEKNFLTAALEQGHGQVAQTARELGMSRRTLQGKIRRYGIKVTGMRKKSQNSHLRGGPAHPVDARQELNLPQSDDD